MTYERNSTNRGVPVVLIVSDPSDVQRVGLYFEPIKSGKLVELDKFGRPTSGSRSTTGLYKVLSRLHSSGTSILEGAVVFEL